MYTCLLQIMTDETEKCSNELQRTAFCQPNIDVSNFLNLNSLTNHDAFCLAYIFTYRDFSHGTLGLAWVGSPTGNTLISRHVYVRAFVVGLTLKIIILKIITFV